MEEEGIRFASRRGKWVLAATVLGSGMAFLDSTVVNVALPAMGRDLQVGFAELQWIVDAYLLVLSALVLLGGALGDLYGLRRMFVVGLCGFAAASALCGAAPTAHLLIFARAVQGLSAALLVPGSLAILSTAIHPDDRGKAIGAWSGLSGVSSAIGPLVGGLLVDDLSWRLVFFINLPLAAVALVISLAQLPERRNREAPRPDLLGGLAATLALGGTVYALIEGPLEGATIAVLGAAAVGLASGVAFVWIEARSHEPMLPLGLFRAAAFTGANLTTLLVYFALGGALFLLIIQLQQAHGYTALQAGAALIPVTVLLLVLSPLAGRLSDAMGPRVPMTVGPIIAGGGLCLLAGIGERVDYLRQVLPPILTFGLGLSLTVAPLTSAALRAAPSNKAGVASGVNNAVARTAGLLAVAMLPWIGGSSSAEVAAGEITANAFHRTLWASGLLCAAGGFVAWFTIPKAIRAVPRRDA